MLNIFGKKNTFLGLDIGTSAIKIAEVKFSGNRPILTNYGKIRFEGSFGDREMRSPSFDAVLGEYIKKIIKESRVESESAFASIPAFEGLITLIEFPNIEKENLEQAIRFEAHKYIPTSLDSVVFSWDIVGKNSVEKIIDRKKDALSPQSKPSETKQERIQVLLVAASKNKVSKYENIISSTGLELKGIEIESFSMVRSLVGNDQGNFLVIDIGSRVCNIILVEKGIIKINRNIDAGGKEMTKSIATSMNIDEKRAEKMKISGYNFFDGQSSIKFPTLELIVSEITRVINAYYKDEPKTKVDAIILSGGTASMFGLADFFQKAMQIRTVIGNPFGRLQYDQSIEPRIKEIGTQFSVAVGLALKGEMLMK